jgi:hypothetical protein
VTPAEVFELVLAAETDPRRIDLLMAGVHYTRREPCENCGAPLALREHTKRPGDLVDTEVGWVEVVRSGDRPYDWVIREHNADGCRARRAGSVPRGSVTG